MYKLGKNRRHKSCSKEAARQLYAASWLTSSISRTWQRQTNTLWLRYNHLIGKIKYIVSQGYLFMVLLYQIKRNIMAFYGFAEKRRTVTADYGYLCEK
jgi:hypothetical protein